MIRIATEKDVELLVDINTLSNDPVDRIIDINDDFVTDMFENLMKDKSAEVYLFEDKGVAVFIKEFSGFNNCEMHWLTVDEKFHRKGIATMLLNLIQKRAKELKFRGIYLYTHPLHEAGIALYKKQGFEKINEFPNYYTNGDTSLLFGKML
ncbi:MAG: GNAT family N-acetyltransferase [Deltaproteobacteria bacterium]|nr:GNAT family N-acetyltransferase [Deltaproteobacteria bacterium]